MVATLTITYAGSTALGRLARRYVQLDFERFMNKIESEFKGWLETILSEDLPVGISGFAINLYEGPYAWDAELIGAPTFDPINEDWACDDIFMSDRFEIPHEKVSEGWEAALNEIALWFKDYLMAKSEGAIKLLSADGIGIGFVDGNLILLKGAAT